MTEVSEYAKKIKLYIEKVGYKSEKLASYLGEDDDKIIQQNLEI
jgi:hypothetical protein